MAYAYNALDDYLKRGKQGGKTQDLQKGGGGAPPPTAAAQDLAKTAETSAEQGNAARRFEAMQKAPTGAIAGRLAAPAKQQAASWEKQETGRGQQYKEGTQKTIEETFKEYNPENLGAAEKGDTEATTQLTQQIGYGNQPFQVGGFQTSAPTLDTTSMLSGGVGGIQSALQKKGGRYTPGMAAYDASALAANRGAVGQLQSQFGGLQQGMRERAAELNLLPEQMLGEAESRGARISQQVRDAVQARNDALRAAQDEAARIEAEKRGGQSRTEAERLARQASGRSDIASVRRGGKQTYVSEVDPAYARMAAILGLNATPSQAEYEGWAPDLEAINTQLRAEQEARNTPQPKGDLPIAPEEMAPPPGTIAPGVIAVGGAGPGIKGDTTPVTGPAQTMQPGQMPTAGMSDIGAAVETASGTQQAIIPNNVRKDISTVKGQGSGYDIPDVVVSGFYNENGRYPTKDELSAYRKNGRWPITKMPKFTFMGKTIG